MWKRDESVQPPPSPAPRPESPRQTASVEVSESRGAAPSDARGAARIGKSVVIKGELTASEDLIIDGTVEGKIELKNNVVTVGAEGRVNADILAKAAVVQGKVVGNVKATERVDIRDDGSLDGDLSSPRIAIADGAHFRGSIDMQR